MNRIIITTQLAIASIAKQYIYKSCVVNLLSVCPLFVCLSSVMHPLG